MNIWKSCRFKVGTDVQQTKGNDQRLKETQEVQQLWSYVRGDDEAERGAAISTEAWTRYTLNKTQKKRSDVDCAGLLFEDH